ncbi:MAG TPA: GNAT family N-acetyltransferase [Caulobacteraceae bacterium]|nr:GNAT family N-acetyltransferase [Caulobacteraceae bacterium]
MKRLRPATPKDAEVLSEIHRRAAFLPPLHDADENLRFVRDELMVQNEVWVSEAGGEVVGYVAFSGGWLSHLFVHPDHQGKGVGAALLSRVIADGRERQLWTFAGNARARAFYERRGWVLAERTDGQGNEHGQPEVRYVWRP